MKFKSIFSKFMLPMILILGIFATAILGITGNLLEKTYNSQIIKHDAEINSFISQSVGSFMNKAYAVTEELAYSRQVLSMNGWYLRYCPCFLPSFALWFSLTAVDLPLPT